MSHYANSMKTEHNKILKFEFGAKSAEMAKHAHLTVRFFLKFNFTLYNLN